MWTCDESAPVPASSCYGKGKFRRTLETGCLPSPWAFRIGDLIRNQVYSVVLWVPSPIWVMGTRQLLQVTEPDPHPSCVG